MNHASSASSKENSGTTSTGRPKTTPSKSSVDSKVKEEQAACSADNLWLIVGGGGAVWTFVEQITGSGCGRKHDGTEKVQCIAGVSLSIYICMYTHV